MTDLPETVPRDDRAWPRSAVAVSSLVVLASLVAGGGAVTAAADSGPLVLGAVAASFVVTFGVAFVVFGWAFRHRVEGRPVPGGLTALEAGFVLAALAVLYLGDTTVGVALLAGLIGGLMLANIRAVRAARGNRDLVEAAEAAAAREWEAEPGSEGVAPLDDTTSRPRVGDADGRPVGHLLREARGDEGRRWVAWVAAGGLVVTGAEALGAPTAFVAGAAGLAVVGLASTTRRLWAVWWAIRDLRSAATAPRRAFVVLLHDPNPQAYRPLLGVWSEPPRVRDGRLAPPERVFRCSEVQDALECRQGDVVVHEAWVDTGPRRGSKPRWVAADAGLVLPHRGRLVLGRWYLSNLIRGERPGAPEPLTRPMPHHDREGVAVEAVGASAGPGFLGALAWRLVGVVAVGALFVWFT